MAVKPGDIIELPEESYKYGQGLLRLRVTAIRRDLLPLYEHKEVWLRGHKVHWNGQEDRDQIAVLVAVAALPDGTV